MAKEIAKEREERSKREERKVKRKQSRVSLETHSKPVRAHAKRRLPCTCTYDEAGAAAVVGGWGRGRSLRLLSGGAKEVGMKGCVNAWRG